MYTRTDDTTHAVRALLLAAIMIVSMAAVGGVAAQPTNASVGDGPELASQHIPDSGNLSSDEFLVDDDYEPQEVNDDDLLYSNISAAVAAAGDGYTIYVKPGTYDESVTIDHRIELIGAGMDQVEVTGNSVALTITADDVTVQGFTFVGDEGDNVVEVRRTSPTEDVKDLTFVDNRVIVDDDATGLYHEAMDQDQPSHDETLIANNVFTLKVPGDESDPSTRTDANYHIWIDSEEVFVGEEEEPTVLQPHNIVIDNNQFTSPDHKEEYGVMGSVESSVRLEADHSEVTNNLFETRVRDNDANNAQLWIGSDVDEKTDILVESNEFYANWAEYNIWADVMGGDTLTIRDNFVTDAQEVGIMVDDFDMVLIEENNVHSNHGPGVVVMNGNDVDVLANDIVDNVDIGLKLANVTDGFVHENYIADTSGSVGLLLDEVQQVSASYNTLENNDYGAAIAGSTTKNVELRKNTFIDNAAVGVHVVNFDSGATEAERPMINYNDFSEQDHDVKNDQGNALIDARLNWFGVNDSSISDEASVEGAVIYDPFLTEEPWDIEQEKHKTEAFAHDFTIQESTGPVHVIAFPGPVDRTVGEVFEDLPEGTGLYMYDAQTESWSTPSDGDDIDALDAFVITDLPEDETFTIVAGYEGNGNAAPHNKDLAGGWNLIGAPEKGLVEESMTDASTASETKVTHIYEGPRSQPMFLNGEDAAGTDKAWAHTVSTGDQPCVSPYTGYWVYVDEDDTGGMPSNLYAGVTYTGEIDQLSTDEPCNDDD